ncbi:MAG: hypothetical protein LW717_16075 [Chloroflexaceae bacterium]|nr:hypothetical protein [Chloroflexaceae bacterium]
MLCDVSVLGCGVSGPMFAMAVANSSVARRSWSLAVLAPWLAATTSVTTSARTSLACV